MKQMDRAALDGVELEYEVRGAGEPVVLIHAGCCADFFKPLMEEPALADRFRLVRYHRTGYAGSTRVMGSVSIAQQAAHCHSLLRHLGIERAHIVGHSSSAMMALQLALDAPEVVHTLALLDAARPAPQSEVQMEFVKTVVQPSLQRYDAGDQAGAVDIWLEGTCGLDYRAAL
jgi:pimeloyl-ACP methyl ester carboxylesterase